MHNNKKQKQSDDHRGFKQTPEVREIYSEMANREMITNNVF